jgi:predicted O-linked N-acetylglucosamine transferase (SPINDLY family)
LSDAVGLARAGRLAEAAEVARRAAAEDGRSTEASLLAAQLLMAAGHAEQGAFFAERATQLAPGHAPAHVVLGQAHGLAMRQEKSLAAFERAIAIDPTSSAAHAGAGAALRAMLRLGGAIGHLERAAALSPREPEHAMNLALAQLARGDAHAALRTLAGAIERHPGHAQLRAALAQATNYAGGVSIPDAAAAHRAYGVLVERAVAPHDRWNVRADPDRVIRLGFLSRDLHRHSCSYFLKPLLERLDRASVRSVVYQLNRHEDDQTTALRALADEWRSVGADSNERVCERIRQDGIDVLMELSGHTMGHRLDIMARRAAPVQASWLGYPNTTGLTRIAWRIVDALTDPEGGADEGAWYAEGRVRLDGCFVCYREPDEAAAARTSAERQRAARWGAGTAPRGDDGSGVVFGSFNAQEKFSAETLDLWAAVLGELPGSTLMLKNRSLADESVRERTLAALEARGVERGRVRAVSFAAGLGDHLAMYGGVDVALDTFPYHGTTTTCEAASMGVPTVTLVGDRHAARVGLSLNTALGVPELCATDRAGFVAAAARLARDPAGRDRVRSTLRSAWQTGVLRDEAGFAARFAGAVRAMWCGWCDSDEGRSHRVGTDRGGPGAAASGGA